MIGMTVCSGIGAPEVAAPWVDWRYQSEIEPFPSAVLAHRFPNAVNVGDMTKFQEWPDAAIDVLVGGTPCQSFSVAGLRKGLDDPRGNLMLTFLAIARRYRPRWIVWENVPGVLSSNGGRDFGAFLWGLGECGYGWAYRVLDAQYVRTPRFPRAVPQRRRRVFVVGHLGDWRRAAAVLFEPEGLQGHPPPRRETWKRATAGAANGIDLGNLETAHDPDERLICADAAPTLNAHFGDKMGYENQHINSGAGLFVAHASSPTLRTRRPGETGLADDEMIVAVPEISQTLHTMKSGNAGPDTTTYVAHALRGEGFDASEDGTGRGTPLVPMAFSSKDYGGDAELDLSPTLRAGAHDGSHANAGVPPAVAFAHQAGGKQSTLGASDDGVSPTLASRQTPAVAQAWAVRRMTPLECERLQGFPEGWTQIPYRNKPADQCPDGPRYKALGNSWAVNCGELIFDRMRIVDAMPEASLEAAE